MHPLHRFTLFIALGLLVLTSLLGCHPKPSTSPAMTHYKYVDAMGNVYDLHPDRLIYDPVKPERSSSGMADGGDPAQATLTKVQYDELVSLFETAIADKSAHLQDRIKGCGSIYTERDGDKQGYFLRMDSAVKSALESRLKGILGK